MSKNNLPKLFGYGESNPELPRRNLTTNVIRSLRGGNVSRYTIPDEMVILRY